MLGLRPKMFFAFGGLFALLVLVAGLAMAVIDKVSQSFDRIFHENLESIHACQEMRESLESIHAGLLISLWENTAPETSRVSLAVADFTKQLDFQRGNVTVWGEQALTDSLTREWSGFKKNVFDVIDDTGGASSRRDRYHQEILPAYLRMEGLTRRISDLNAQNILSADGQLRAQAKAARRTMILLLATGGALVLVLLFLTSRLMLKPIQSLLLSAQEIARGNLDLSLEVRSQDELGRLAEAFNGMATRLREFRRTDRAKLLRTQRTTQMAINSLPDAVAVFSSQGTVDMSNEPAQRLFGIKPGTQVESLGKEWLTILHAKVARELRPFNPQGYEAAIQIFRDGSECYFLPHAIPILDESRQLMGVTVVLADVTELRRLDEAKSDLLATVSHELKTRLTSVRMAVHLLLDENLGGLNAKQTDLVLTAREDAERLYRIIEGLLDIGRIRSGNLKMRLQAMDAQELILNSVEAVRHAMQDKGLKLTCDLPADLPQVAADPSRVHLILANLLANALKYTPAGGSVKVTAARQEEGVRVAVADTGIGIPADDVPHVFERFFRGVREGEPGGAGLGLAIAKEVVEAHGGTIGLESQIGEGTTVHFTLMAMLPEPMERQT